VADQEQSFGQVLRALRGTRTQREIADATGISQTYYSDLELDKATSPSREVITGLARSLGVAYSQLALAALGETATLPDQLGLEELPPSVIAEVSRLWPDLTTTDQDSVLEHIRALSERRKKQRVHS